MAVAGKFYVAEIRKFANGGNWAEPAPMGEVTLQVVTRGEENKVWASATPTGTLKMTVRGSAFPWFEERLGKDVSILLDDPEQS